MILLACAALLTAAPAGEAQLAEAAHALANGRVEQARLMTAAAVAEGAGGEALERQLADLAAAQGRLDEAASRYDALLQARPQDAALLERAAAVAWRRDLTELAGALARRATARPDASWKAWNLLAITADSAGDHATADTAYARALALAPDRAELRNNQGWSYLLRGEWARALALFERAHAADPSSPVLANNLELARAALADDLPARRAGESDEAWAARLNDAGVAARMRGDEKRAAAAFARAIEARRSWYKRAEANLTATGAP